MKIDGVVIKGSCHSEFKVMFELALWSSKLQKHYRTICTIELDFDQKIKAAILNGWLLYEIIKLHNFT